MQRKRTVILWALLAALMFYSPLLAQDKKNKQAQQELLSSQDQSDSSEKGRGFVGWTEEEFLNHLDKLSTEEIEHPGRSVYLGSQFFNIARKAASFGSEGSVQKILEIPECNSCNQKNHRFNITHAKVKALRVLKDYQGVREYVMQSLEHESPRVQIAAASTLLYWGEEWELSSAVICKHEEYIEFQQNKDERAVPLLEEAVENGSMKGRLYAAAALYYTYGDSIKYPEVALDIILNAPAHTDDKDVNWAKSHALRQVPRFNLESSLPGLIRLTNDNDPGIRSMVVGHLVHLSAVGYQEATQTLIDVKDNHPDASIREQAKHGLEKLNATE